MIYKKCEIFGHAIKVPLHVNGFYSDCPICGCEVAVEYEIVSDIMQDYDLDGSVHCDACSEKLRESKTYKIHRIK